MVASQARRISEEPAGGGPVALATQVTPGETQRRLVRCGHRREQLAVVVMEPFGAQAQLAAGGAPLVIGKQ
jgi:hypothetical protein